VGYGIVDVYAAVKEAMEGQWVEPHFSAHLHDQGIVLWSTRWSNIGIKVGETLPLLNDFQYSRVSCVSEAL